ncbi:MAG: flagellar basal body P-ring formation protein FlgA [Sinobacteraceae bacterium]|nr:flagellar basal body P-ring formation protein FlgA [Nevskiaceae bacterium]
MKRTTKYRRTPPRLRALWLACAGAAISTIAVAQESPVESLAAIRGAAETYVKSLIPPNVLESTVTVGQLDSRLRLAHCPAKDLSASLPAGVSLQTRATVGVMCSGTAHWTIYVPVAVESRLKVLVLTHAANRDDRLTAADVTVETRKAAGPGNAYLTQPAELAGRAVRHPLAAGTTLSVDMFTADLVVRRGQTVTLVSSGSAVEVRASGRAMADGTAGARIEVQNLSSLHMVEGIVESADLVRVSP